MIIRFDAIKKLSPEARSALNLYECAVSSDNANSTLWIFKEQPWPKRLNNAQTDQSNNLDQ